jgi:glutathione S-transferase
MKLYYSPGSCSLAPHVVLHEVGAVHELVPVPLADRAQHAAGYEEKNPLRRVPVLEKGAVRLTETAAILQYLADTHPAAGLVPEDPWERARVAEHCAFLSSTLHIDFAQHWRQERFTTDKAAYEGVTRRGHENVAEHLAILESRLAEGPFALGARYSIVDPYLLVFHRWTRRIGLEPTAFRRFTTVAKSVLARPSTQRAMAAEGLEYAI